MTKIVVATLLVLLAEDGRLELDSDAEQWVDVPSGITVRQLLRHTSGLPDYAANPALLEPYRRDPTHVWRPEQLLELAGSSTTGAGSFSYSNTNYVVLGLVAERVGGAALGEQLARRVFEPLGLRETGLAAGAEPERYARAYLPADNPLFPGAGDGLVDVTDIDLGGRAAGGLVSTAGDVARFLSGLLSGELLSSASLEDMLSTIPGDGGEFVRYGLGIAEMDSFLGIVPSSCGSAWGHLGLSPGCTCAALSTRDGARQAVLMASGPLTEAFGGRMWEAFCG